jgi:hypothetical protein
MGRDSAVRPRLSLAVFLLGFCFRAGDVVPCVCRGQNVSTSVVLIPKTAGKFTTAPAQFSYEIDSERKVCQNHSRVSHESSSPG